MFKRISKIIGIVLAIFVVVCGLGVGIFALRGGFKDNNVNILRIYMDDSSKADKTIYTLEDFSATINFEPLNATNKTLDVVIQDPLRQVDANGELIKEGILKNVPKTIVAGQPLNIEINKDDNGNNIGGAVTLTFKPRGNAITEFKLKVVVDVAIPNNSLYFAGNNSDSYSAVSGKTITMGISNNEQYVYLKSNLVNAFYLEADNRNLKSAYISYTYKNLKGELVEEKNLDNLSYDRVYNSSTGEYNYYFKVPVTPKESGTILMTAKMHKTYAIAEEYIANDFDNIIEPTSENVEAQAKLDKYNEFLNKYISYFDTTSESYDFFKNHMSSDGKVKLPYRAVSASKNFVFQTCKSTINISAVNLQNISSTDNPQEFQVFSKQTYTLSDMIEKFGLDISLDKDNVAQITKEKENLFSTLQVSPYIYIEKSEYLNTKDSLWQNYGIVLGVTNFTSNGKPIVSSTTISSDNIESDEFIGFLVALSGKNSYKEYITSDLKNDAENKVWTLEFNVPLVQNSTETSIKNASKALFLQFQVTGRDLDTNKTIVKDDYTRIYIDYEEYNYLDEDSAKITFANELKRMSINTNVQNAQSYGYARELNTQSISVSLANSISNYDRVQYKNVMYFVEKNSNTIDGGGTKLATVGSYKFRYMNSGAAGSSPMIKLFDSDSDLIGERLLNMGTISESDYRLYAINASNEPAKIFAVVYLSDEKGMPIDIDGRPITINENLVGGEEPTLVVFAITDITSNGMASVNIDNFVDNINYYTQSKIGYSINETKEIDGQEVTLKFEVAENSYVKRNRIDEYYDLETGYAFSEKLKDIQDFLKLKLLYKNRLDLYATNFEWDDTGMPSADATANTTLLMNVKDFYGNIITNKAYEINTYQNKQLALNNMANDFVSNYYLNVQSTNSTPVQKVEILYADPEDTSSVIGVKFEIVADGKNTSTDDFIYIKPREGVANALDSNRKDYVSWEVNKLQIEDVELDSSVSVYNKLYASYSSNANADKKQVFGNVQYNNGTLNFDKYFLYTLDPNEVKGSVNDNIKFKILTNLYDTTKFSGTNGMNVDLIDMSQATYDATSEGIITDTNKDLFANISAYINYYTNNTNTMSVTYSNPTGTAQILQDLYFPSENGYICVGSKKYEKKTGNVVIYGENYTRYITVNGRNYPITISTDVSNFKGEEVVVIKKGEYFPIIKGYQENGNPIMIICDEEFVIGKYDGDETKGLILNISDQSTGRYRNVLVSKTTTINSEIYNPNKYIDDGYNDNTNTALEKDTITSTVNGIETTFVKSASVKFYKGGTLKDAEGNEIFVKDVNGKYWFNESTNQYEICQDGTAQDKRYSKKGIIAYMMITYKFSGLNGENSKPITKVIAYELNQEPVTLVATGKINNQAGGVELLDANTITDKIEINAGSTTSFSLGSVYNANKTKSESYSINIVGATYEVEFFKHCTFTIADGVGSSSGIKFIQNGQEKYSITVTSTGESIVLSVPNKYKDDVATIIISYTDEDGVVVEKRLNLRIIANYSFSSKGESDGIKTDNESKQYIISLNGYGDSENYKEYGVETDIIKAFFNTDSKIKLVPVDATQNHATLNDDSLKIGSPYVIKTATNILTKNYVQFYMYIVDGNNELKIENVLTININPKYTIDLSKLTGDVLYGTKILTKDYLTIYSGFGVVEDNKINDNNMQNIIDSIAFELFRNNTMLTNGQVISDDMYTTLENVTFEIRWNNGLGVASSYEFALNVIGFDKFYSEKGEFSISTTYDEANQEEYVTTKNYFEFVMTDVLNLNKFFRAYSKNNVLQNNIYVVCVVNNIPVVNITEFGSFKLAYALMIDGEFQILATTNITVDVKKLDMFYSVTGFDKGVTYDDLIANDDYRLTESINLVTDKDTLTVSDHFKLFIDGVEVSPRLKADGSYYTEIDVSAIAGSTEKSKTFTVSCFTADLLSMVDTDITITISKQN